MVRLPFVDRIDAARQLAPRLSHLHPRPLVLAIPRGAVPMGRELARLLGADFDVVMARKLGAPGNPEYAVGAVDESGTAWIAPHAIAAGADKDFLAQAIAAERRTMRERRARWTPGRVPANPCGRVVIVVDDGLATGATMRVALDAVRRRSPARLVCAVPVAAADSLAMIAAHCDEVVCLHAPRDFHSVGTWYVDFDAVDDPEVARCLAAADPGPGADDAPHERRIELVDATLLADLELPQTAVGLVVFTHGSGSGRHSPRNRHVAAILREHHLATLLPDLLGTDEDRDASARFDIAVLARRLAGVVDWARAQPRLRGLPIGLFGASTGAAAAIEVAAARPGPIAAVVSRGGRSDLASPRALARLDVPTLLLVGSDDREVIEINRAAQTVIGSMARLQVIAGATHLFEEPGTLDAVAEAAADWFLRWLPAAQESGG
jgi:predicted phosphoribosyltransferase/dienelactone hydrolase